MTAWKRKEIFYRAMAFILAAAGGLAAVSCSHSGLIGNKLEEMVVTEKDNDKTVTLSQGGILVVRLEYSAGTGYAWQVKEYDRQGLEFLGESTAEISGIPGGRETCIFRFKALQAGVYPIEIDYFRPWEKGTPPIKAFNLKLDIRDGK